MASVKTKVFVNACLKSDFGFLPSLRSLDDITSLFVWLSTGYRDLKRSVRGIFQHPDRVVAGCRRRNSLPWLSAKNFQAKFQTGVALALNVGARMLRMSAQPWRITHV
ncbi:hypothetical protein TW80_13770 [Loktanella sp. S4079]|nr:hypothetical protein TW80_13770 [Loktanella sp. S4079]